MTTINILIITGSVLVIILNIANIISVRKIAKRNRELQERLTQINRAVMLQNHGKGNPWHTPPEPKPSEYPPSFTKL